MSKAPTLQDDYLNQLRKKKTHVFIYLANGIKLQGYVYAFDQYVVVLKGSHGPIGQMIYKHAISTISPNKYPHSEHDSAADPD